MERGRVTQITLDSDHTLRYRASYRISRCYRAASRISVKRGAAQLFCRYEAGSGGAHYGLDGPVQYHFESVGFLFLHRRLIPTENLLGPARHTVQRCFFSRYRSTTTHSRLQHRRKRLAPAVEKWDACQNHGQSQ